MEASQTPPDQSSLWRDPQSYAYTETLTAPLWAWEFLRRNPVYQQERAAFWRTWQALEADYGTPPQRDYLRWKQDPRAYVQATDAAGDGCRIDQDKVLIECALGERWGFYQFPQDPALRADELVGGITWREPPREVHRVIDGGDPFIGAGDGRLALGFDLRLPLREQLERAKRHLQMLQRRGVREGSLRMHTVKSLRGEWLLALRCLDAQAAGADAQSVAVSLNKVDAQAYERYLQEGQRLRDGGYRDIAWLPER